MAQNPSRPANGKQKVKKQKKAFTHIDFELRSPLLRRILIVAFAALAVVFAVYQIASLGSTRTAKLKTQTALSRTITKNIPVQGVVIREETVLPSSAGGTVVPRVENGSKVSAGDTVAEIFRSDSAAHYLLELDDVEDSIAYYENIQNLGSGNIYENKDAYNQNISNALFALIADIGDNRLAALPEGVRDLSAAVTKKQTVIGRPADVSGRLTALYQRRETLSGYINSGAAVTADRAGYYVDKADGYEDLMPYGEVLAATPAAVQQMLAKQPARVNGNVGKLITQFNWYLLCAMDSAEAADLKTGQKLNIAFAGYSGGAIKMQLAAKNEGPDGKTALVFRCNLMNSEIASLRMDDVKICLEEYTGFAVDKTALRTVDGQLGVYVLTGRLVMFRKVEIVYSDDTIILASAKGESGYLRRYDEIITEGTDLYDEKIVG